MKRENIIRNTSGKAGKKTKNKKQKQKESRERKRQTNTENYRKEKSKQENENNKRSKGQKEKRYLPRPQDNEIIIVQLFREMRQIILRFVKESGLFISEKDQLPFCGLGAWRLNTRVLGCQDLVISKRIPSN